MWQRTDSVFIALLTWCATGLAAEPAADLVPPDCLWVDGFADSSRLSVLDGAELRDGRAKLRWRQGRKAAYVDKDPAVTKSSGWGKGTSCSTKGAKLTWKFNGEVLKVYGPRGPDMGIFEVWIDGKRRKRVDRYKAARRGGVGYRIAATVEGLGYGDHVAQLVVTGEKHEESTSARVTILALESYPAGFHLEGQLVSAPIIAAPGAYRWGTLHYQKTTPEGTSLKVDVLDAAGKPVMSDVPDGADLSALKIPMIKLRARLATTNPLVSPSLDLWSVAFTSQAQPEGVLAGCVLGGDGNPLGGATIVAFQQGKEKARTETSDSGGYCFKDLAPGQYELQVRADGFLSSRPVAVDVPCRRMVGFQLHGAADVEQSRYTVWVANPMLNIFKDFGPDHGVAEKTIRMEAARNEYEPAQFAVTARAPLGPVSVRLHPLVHTASGHTIGNEQMEWNFVGYIHTAHQRSGPDVLRKAPCELPDTLLLERETAIKAGQTQPVWITVKVPRDAPAGDYTGAVDVLTPYGASSIPLRLHVWPFTLTDESHTWMGHGGSGWERVVARYRTSDTEEERWRIIKMCLKNRAEHRENAIYTDHTLFSLTRVTVAQDGSWRFDFSQFDKWIETILSFYQHGKVMIELGCFASCSHHTKQIFFGGWRVYNEDGSVNKEHSIGHVEADSPEFEKFAKRFFPAVEKHLEEKGWLEKVYTRMADEPNKPCKEAYKRFAAIVHKAAKARGASEGKFDPLAASLALCARAVRSCTDFERDPQKLLALRREVARQIVQLGEKSKLHR